MLNFAHQKIEKIYSFKLNSSEEVIIFHTYLKIENDIIRSCYE
jgi:hypothetical protein